MRCVEPEVGWALELDSDVEVAVEVTLTGGFELDLELGLVLRIGMLTDSVVTVSHLSEETEMNGIKENHES